MLAPGPVSPRWSARRLAAALGLLVLCGCGPSELEIADARARYAAAVDGFVVRQEPLPDGRLEQEVELGLLVRREAGREGSEGRTLPGVTLDVDLVDAAGRGKRHWRLWIETAGLAPGGQVRSVQVLEGVDYAPGDRFQAEVRQTVPAAERAAYREWSDSDGSATEGGPAS